VNGDPKELVRRGYDALSYHYRDDGDWNPISALVAACRGLFGNPTVIATHTSFPLRHPVAMTIGWSLLLLAIFVPLSAWRYQTADR